MGKEKNFSIPVGVAYSNFLEEYSVVEKVEGMSHSWDPLGPLSEILFPKIKTKGKL